MAQNNNIFLDFETNLIQNMQALNILKSNKEYILRNINTPFRKWLYSDSTNVKGKSMVPFSIINSSVNTKSGNVVFPKLHVSINKSRNTFSSKYNLYEINSNNHPLANDCTTLLKCLSKKVPLSKNNTLLGQTKTNIMEDLFFEDSNYLDYITSLLFSLNLIEKYTKKARYDSVKITDAGKEFIKYTSAKKMTLLRQAGITVASNTLRQKLAENGEMIATLLQMNNVNLENTSISLDFFSEEKLESMLSTTKTIDLESYYTGIFKAFGLDRAEYVKYFAEKAPAVENLENAYEDNKLFLAIYMFDIENMFDDHFVVPFSYYFMSLAPKYQASFNCESTIIEMLLAQQNKRMCETLNYNVPVSISPTGLKLN